MNIDLQTGHDKQSALQERLAALKDPADANSDREREQLRAIRHEMEMHINTWPSAAERLASLMTKRAFADDALKGLRSVEKQLNDAIAHAVDTRQSEERLDALAIAKKVLLNGCHYNYNGKPMLPDVLRELLTPPPCSSCNRPHEPVWSGPIEMFEQDLVALDKHIAEAQFFVNAHVSSATALLNEMAASV